MTGVEDGQDYGGHWKLIPVREWSDQTCSLVNPLHPISWLRGGSLRRQGAQWEAPVMSCWPGGEEEGRSGQTGVRFRKQNYCGDCRH